MSVRPRYRTDLETKGLDEYIVMVDEWIDGLNGSSPTPPESREAMIWAVCTRRGGIDYVFNNTPIKSIQYFHNGLCHFNKNEPPTYLLHDVASFVASLKKGLGYYSGPILRVRPMDFIGAMWVTVSVHAYITLVSSGTILFDSDINLDTVNENVDRIFDFIAYWVGNKTDTSARDYFTDHLQDMKTHVTNAINDARSSRRLIDTPRAE